MALISFPKRNCIIGKLNVRLEVHGDTKVPACDISLSGIPFDRDDLDKLCGPYYSRSLYNESGKGKDGKVVTPALPRLGSLHLTDTFYKCRATLSFEMNDKKIEFARVKDRQIKIKDVVLECQDGGTTMVSLKIQAYPSDDDLGRLYAHQGMQQSVTLFFGPTVDESEETTKGSDKQETLALGEGGARSNKVDDVEQQSATH